MFCLASYVKPIRSELRLLEELKDDGEVYAAQRRNQSHSNSFLFPLYLFYTLRTFSSFSLFK